MMILRCYVSGSTGKIDRGAIDRLAAALADLPPTTTETVVTLEELAPLVYWCIWRPPLSALVFGVFCFGVLDLVVLAANLLK